MKYFLVLFVFGIHCQNTFASGLGHPVFNDFDRRLVRLEERQFTESENLEHRMLKLETKLGTQELSFNESSVRENPAEGMNFLQRLEKLEKELEEQLVKFSSKYENLAERFSAIEKHVEEHKSSAFDQIKESQNTPPEESKTTPHEEPKSDKSEDVKFFQVGGKTYHTSSEKKNWFDAKDKCLEMQAHLVSLQNEEEWSALGENLQQDSYWTDINDIIDENVFQSGIFGDEANFLMWDKGEPNSKPRYENCVALRAESGYKMSDEKCSDLKYFICEK